MLKYAASFLLLFFSWTIQSQVLISLLLGDKLNTGEIEFGLDGGFSLSNLEGEAGAESHSNYNLGFYFDFKLKNPSWLLNTGVRVKSTMGAEGMTPYSLNDPELDNAFTGGSITRKINYFNVPFSLKYKFKNRMYAHGGIQLGLMYKATDVFTKDVQEKEDLTYKLNVKDRYHPFDGGLLVGLGYRMISGNGMNLGIQYYYGLVDVRVYDGSPNQYNRCLYVNAGIPIGRGKALADTE